MYRVNGFEATFEEPYKFLGARRIRQLPNIAPAVNGSMARGDGQWLTAGDAAAILGISSDMVGVLAKNGSLPHERTEGGYRLFRRSDVEQLAKARQERVRRTGKAQAK